VRFLPLLDPNLVVLNFASENIGPDSFLSLTPPSSPLVRLSLFVTLSRIRRRRYVLVFFHSTPSLRLLRANHFLLFPSLPFELGELTSSLEGVWRVSLLSFSLFPLSRLRRKQLRG